MALALCLTLLPTTALAADSFLTVGGASVTGNGWKNSDGTASYNNDVLTLNNYNGGSIITYNTITIELKGTNTITADTKYGNYEYSDDLCGIGYNNAYGAGITITGDGSLTINADGEGTHTNGCGIATGNRGVIIKDSISMTINVKNFKAITYAIYGSSFATISSGDLNLNVTYDSDKNSGFGGKLRGIMADSSYEKAISLGGTGSKTIALTGKATGNITGLRTELGGVAVDRGSLSITYTGTSDSDGISSDKIVALNADVTITGVTDGVCSTASSSNGPITIKGGNINITVGSGNAILTRGDLTITGNPVITATRTSTSTSSDSGSVVSVNGGKSDINLTGGGSMTITGKIQDMLLGGDVTLGTDTAVTTGKWDETKTKYVGTANSDGKYQLVIAYNPVPAATVDNVTISGSNKEFADQEITVTLRNDTFATTLSGTWITNLPTGLSQSVTPVDSTHAKISISGKPATASNAALAITIPSNQLVTSSAPLTVTSNPNAKFDISLVNDVTITAGEGMSPTGNATQRVNAGTAMTNVVYTADNGYYFPEGYTVASTNGVSVTRDSYTQVTVYGTPAADTTIVLPDATEKTDKETTPTATFTATGYDTGKLTGVTPGMKYRVGANGSWNDISDTSVSLNSLTTLPIYVVKTGGDTKLDSDAQEIYIVHYTKPLNLSAVACTSNANNDGKITGISSGMVYKLSTDTTWIDCNGTEITGLTGGQIYDIRVKEADYILASETVTVTVPRYQELGGSVTVDGTAKYGETLKANTTGLVGHIGTLSYQWTRNDVDIEGATGNTYTLTKDDINAKISVVVTDSVAQGSVSGTLVGPVEKADGPKAVIDFTLTFTLNEDGETYTATISPVEGAEYSFDGETYSDVNTMTGCAPDTAYIGYLRMAETDTHKAGAVSRVSQITPKLTVAAPVITPNGGSFTGTQSVTITSATTDALIYYTTDDTTPTTAANLYTGSFDLTDTTRVKAIAVKDGMLDSAVTTAVFTKTSSSGGSSSGSSSGGGSSSDRDSSDSNPVVKTETKNNADGSTTKTETRKDGSVTQTTTGKDGSVSKTETKKDGSSVTENKAADGSTGTVKTGKNGQTEANAKVSAKAVEDAKKNGEPVKAPVEVEASRNSGTAPTVKVELPQNSGKTEVEIPVSNANAGTVAVLVHADGTEEILKASVPTENGIRLTVDGNATVKIVDNSKDFVDTRNHWAREEIDFVSARELVNGISATRYAPDATATRAQLWTILARQNDTDLSGGANWYEKAQLWSKDKGISDGTNPNGTINRAQMVTMLWRTMGQPAAGGSASFADVPADSYYAQAVAWAVENGITAGVGGGRFDPSATCTRAQIAAFLARSMK